MEENEVKTFVMLSFIDELFFIWIDWVYCLWKYVLIKMLWTANLPLHKDSTNVECQKDFTHSGGAIDVPDCVS